MLYFRRILIVQKDAELLPFLIIQDTESEDVNEDQTNYATKHEQKENNYRKSDNKANGQRDSDPRIPLAIVYEGNSVRSKRAADQLRYKYNKNSRKHRLMEFINSYKITN